jgi:hypothetical protein
MFGNAVGGAAASPEPPSTQIISRPSPVSPRRIRSPRKPSRAAALSAGAGRKVDDLLAPVRAQPERDQDRTAHGAGAGLARRHHPVAHQRLIAVGQRPGVDRGRRRVQPPSHRARGRGAHRPAQHRQERLADLARRQPEREAGQDHAVDLLDPPGVGVHDRVGAEAPGPGHRKLDIAEFAQQMAAGEAVAAVRLVPRRAPGQVVLDRLRHASLDQLDHRLARQRPVALAPRQSLNPHRPHNLERTR